MPPASELKAELEILKEFYEVKQKSLSKEKDESDT